MSPCTKNVSASVKVDGPGREKTACEPSNHSRKSWTSLKSRAGKNASNNWRQHVCNTCSSAAASRCVRPSTPFWTDCPAHLRTDREFGSTVAMDLFVALECSRFDHASYQLHFREWWQLSVWVHTSCSRTLVKTHAKILLHAWSSINL